MTIEECRARNCAHVSPLSRRRNCGLTDCSHYPNHFEERWTEEAAHEFEEYEDYEE